MVPDARAAQDRRQSGVAGAGRAHLREYGVLQPRVVRGRGAGGGYVYVGCGAAEEAEGQGDGRCDAVGVWDGRGEWMGILEEDRLKKRCV